MSTLVAALAYAERGWPVLPIEPGAKVPLGTLVPHGCLDATTDIERIRSWWKRYPEANVAIATGSPGPNVLDFDTKEDRPGLTMYSHLRRAGLLRGAGRIVGTPSGGFHLYFAGTRQGGGAIGRERAVELKAAGGYVLVPPSRTPMGEYTELDSRDGGAVLDWDACVRLLAPPKRLPPRQPDSGDIDGLVRWLQSQPVGNRNAACFWASCRAIETGHDPQPLVAAAVAAGLTATEAERTLRSALNRVRRTAS